VEGGGILDTPIVPINPAELPDIVILRTTFLYEADMLSDALEKARIPYYRRIEHTGARPTAMPPMAAQNPGSTYLVISPAPAVGDARQVLSELPITQDPNLVFENYSSTPMAQRFFVILAVLSVAIIGCAVLMHFVHLND